MSKSVTDEIRFQASLMALHTAIESAGKGAARQVDVELPSPVERARPSAGSPQSLRRPDPRGV